VVTGILRSRKREDRTCRDARYLTNRAYPRKSRGLKLPAAAGRMLHSSALKAVKGGKQRSANCLGKGHGAPQRRGRNRIRGTEILKAWTELCEERTKKKEVSDCMRKRVSMGRRRICTDVCCQSQTFARICDSSQAGNSKKEQETLCSRKRSEGRNLKTNVIVKAVSLDRVIG